jgi:hypothetical protein
MGCFCGLGNCSGGDRAQDGGYWFSGVRALWRRRVAAAEPLQLGASPVAVRASAPGSSGPIGGDRRARRGASRAGGRCHGSADQVHARRRLSETPRGSDRMTTGSRQPRRRRSLNSTEPNHTAVAHRAWGAAGERHPPASPSLSMGTTCQHRCSGCDLTYPARLTRPLTRGLIRQGRLMLHEAGPVDAFQCWPTLSAQLRA